jgi:hypothetical protein
MSKLSRHSELLFRYILNGPTQYFFFTLQERKQVSTFLHLYENTFVMSTEDPYLKHNYMATWVVPNYNS